MAQVAILSEWASQAHQLRLADYIHTRRINCSCGLVCVNLCTPLSRKTACEMFDR
jgi:hypothetical protein